MMAKMGLIIASGLARMAEALRAASIRRMIQKGLPEPIPAQPKGKRGRPKGSKSGPKASKLGTPQTIAAPIVHPESLELIDPETPIKLTVTSRIGYRVCPQCGGERFKKGYRAADNTPQVMCEECFLLMDEV